MSAPSASTLFILGASHHRTPIELREKLALTADKIESFRAELGHVSGLREYVILNTCNRVEFYGYAETPDAVDALERSFCDFQGFSPGEFEAVRHRALGKGAIEHLIAVSAGLDSQMLGETEILGQVKSAYAEAQNRHSVGPILNRTFQKAFQYAKHIRTETAITEGQISVANVAVELATKIFGKLVQARILLLGAGDIGEKTTKAFQSRGAVSLTISSRHIERAMALAESFGAAALPFDQWKQRLHEFDIVVCSTAAPDVIVSTAMVRAAMKHRPARPLFLIDLCLPRNVESSAAAEENVFLYNLDDLARIADENLAARAAEVKKAQKILTEKAAYLWDHLSHTGLANGHETNPSLGNHAASQH